MIQVKEPEMGRLSWFIWVGAIELGVIVGGKIFQGCSQRTRQSTSLALNMEEKGDETGNVGTLKRQ